MYLLRKFPIKVGFKQLFQIIFFFLIGFLFFRINISSKLHLLNEPYDFFYWEEQYNKSGWRDPYSKQGIGDDALYVYQGISILRGQDLSLLNPEISPLGKYILGETTLLFNNRFAVSFIFYFLSLLVCIFLTYKITKKKLLSFFLSLLIFSEPVIVRQLAASSIDLVLLFFFLSFILSADLFFVKSIFKKLIPAILLGIFIATKSYFLGVIIVVSLLLASIFSKERKNLKNIILYLLPAFFVYCLVHLPYFLKNHNFFEFLKLHRWVIWFYSNKLEKIFYGGAVWLMLLNRWQTWFGKWYGLYNFIRIEEWWFFLPILLILFLHLILLFVRGKKKLSSESFSYQLIFFWTVLYFIFLNIIPIWSRYFLLLLPTCYILVTKTFLDLRFKAIPFKTILVLAVTTFLTFIFFGRPSGVNSFLAEIASASRNFVFFYGLSGFKFLHIILGIIYFPAYILGNGQLGSFVFCFYWLTILTLILVLFLKQKKIVKFFLWILLIINSLFLINYQLKPKIKLDYILKMMDEPYRLSKGEHFDYQTFPVEQAPLIHYLFEDYGYKRWSYRPKDGQTGLRKKLYQFCLIKTNENCPKPEEKNIRFLFEKDYEGSLQLRGYEYDPALN